MRLLVSKVKADRGRSFGIVALTFAALFGLEPNGNAQVALEDQLGSLSGSVLVRAVFAPEAGPVSGLQFDVEYDSSAISLVAAAGDAVRGSEKNLYYADLAPNKTRFLIVGLNRNVISAGPLVTLFVNLNENASVGVYPLVLSNVIGTDPSGQPVFATGAPGSVTVQGTIDESVRLQADGVLNGGSLLAGPVAAGEVVTLIGSGIGPASGATSDSLSVLFDGASAPILYAAPNQINTVVPDSVGGKDVTQLQVMKGGQALASLSLPVRAAVPAIFTQDSSGVGSGVILNQDSSVNSPSNPAGRGSVATLFATGQMMVPGADGVAGKDSVERQILQPWIRIGGIDADVLHVGPARGFAAGVLQIDFSIPQGATPGQLATIVLGFGSSQSPPGVTLAVK